MAEKRWTIWKCPDCSRNLKSQMNFCGSCKNAAGHYRAPVSEAVVPASELDHLLAGVEAEIERLRSTCVVGRIDRQAEADRLNELLGQEGAK